MRRFSLLAIVFLALCTVCILLMRSCGGDRREENTAATLPPAQEILATAVPESSPEPTPAPTPAPTPSVEGTVWTTSDVNLRRAPGTDGEIITAVDKGTELHRTGLAENGWSKILFQEDIVCYVNSDYLTEIDPAIISPTETAPGNTESPVSPEATPEPGFSVTPLSDTVWTLDGMNLRRGPGTDYDIAVTVEKNTELQRTGVTETGWSRVIYNSVGYYVSSEYLTTVKPEELAEEESENSEAESNALPTDRTFETQGEFRSDTGVPLNVIVRWSVMDRSDGSKSLTLSAALSSCTLHTTSFADNLCFKVGNDTFNLTTPDINVDSAALTETPLGNCTAVVTQFNVPVKVIWHFNGTYSEKQLGDITAATTLMIG